jgi:hypothetical protein
MSNNTKHTFIISAFTVLTFALIATSLIAVYYNGLDQGKTQNNQSTSTNQLSNYSSNNISQDIAAAPREDLSQYEKDSILFMREEEKLARDVYLTLAEKHNVQVFKNISGSEQTHMDTMKTLIDKYNLSDSVKSDTRGEFTNSELAKLYNDLVSKGSQNQIEALKIGATIEDLDISDLNKRLSNNNNQDIRLAFETLLSGSYNHMRAFVTNLQNQGSDYTPQYISQTDYQAIISSSNSHDDNGQQGGGNGRNRK